MAFVNHDDVEIVARVVFRQERELVFLQLVDAEALIGRDMDARVSRSVAALRLARDLGRLAAEQIGKRRRRLRAQLVAVAHEQRAARHPGVEQTPQQVRGNEGLAGPGGEGQQRAPVASGELLKDGSDRRVLVIAPRAFAAAIRREQGARSGRVQIDLGRRLPAPTEIVGIGKLRDRGGVRSVAAGRVVEDELVAVARKDEWHIEAARISAGLLQPVAWRT